jgi:hypothetical protein
LHIFSKQLTKKLDFNQEKNQRKLVLSLDLEKKSSGRAVMLEETGVLAAFVISAAYRHCGFAIRPLEGTRKFSLVVTP